LFLAAGIAAMRNIYAAQRDRKLLERTEIEKEKLELEVESLRNSPEVVKDRRDIYESLRAVLGEMIASGNATNEQIARIHQIRHDATFRYPGDIVTAIDKLLRNAVDLHMTRMMMKSPGATTSSNDEEWRALVQQDHDAWDAIGSYVEAMTETFKPHLSL